MSNAGTAKKSWGFLKICVVGFVGLALFSGVVQSIKEANTTPAEREAAEHARKARQQAEDRSNWRAANIRLAEEAVAASLRDPESAQFRAVVVIAPAHFDKTKKGTVCGEVNGRNAFGAYVGYKSFLTIYGLPAVEDGSREFVDLWNKTCANRAVM